MIGLFNGENSVWYNGSSADQKRKSNSKIVIPSYIRKAFTLARKHAPYSKLGYNDYNIAKGTAKAQFILDFIIEMKNKRFLLIMLDFNFMNGMH